MAGPCLLPRTAFDGLIHGLEDAGYSCVGPTARDGAIVHAPLRSAADLPAGLDAEQEPGRYRLHRRTDGALFAHAVGPGSARAWLDPPEQLRARLRRTPAGFVRDDVPDPVPRRALIGLRACDLAAIDVLDRVYGAGPHADPAWLARREAMLLVAVACTTSAATCFCASAGTGPAVTRGGDVVLTELVAPEHVFLVEARTDRGALIVDRLGLRAAATAELDAARAAVAAAARQQVRALPDTDLPALLERRRDSRRWDDVAERCLACGNCTLVCPTCFCCDVEDTSDLTGEVAERRRRWTSCFAPDFGELHGGDVRASTAARYRHWLSHKLGTWRTQFGTDGCVGCGRCITWCPVGIDLTAEITALAQEDQR